MSTLSGIALSRLMLGTCQFGFKYGIANKSGQPSYETARDIIACAYEGGVDCMDTAASYGESEEVLGRAFAELGIAGKVTVVTKVRRLPGGRIPAGSLNDFVEDSVAGSLKRLRLEALPVCLVHAEGEFSYFAEPLLKLKERGLVLHTGSSVMTPDGARRIISSGLAEAVQVPANVLDHRFSRAGVYEAARTRGVAVFIRSVYLQGLLLMPEDEIPAELKEVVPFRRRLERLAGAAGITLQELAVRCALGIEEAACILVGVDSVAQMRQNIELFAKGPLDGCLMEDVREAARGVPENILKPNTWPGAM